MKQFVRRMKRLAAKRRHMMREEREKKLALLRAKPRAPRNPEEE